MADLRTARIEDLLRRNGPLTAAALGQALGVSQPTMSRLLASAGDRIVRIGRARASRYALGHDIARTGSRWPLYRIDSEGRAALDWLCRELATARAVRQAREYGEGTTH